jgi:uncharacterized protein (TIGR03790 family)
MRLAQALLLSGACLASCGAPAAPSPTETHPEVLVIVNGSSGISRAIGAYYARRRGVPPENVVRLDLPVIDPTLTTRDHETVDRERFERRVRDPVAAHLAERDPEGAIRILVTTKGVPLRIHGGAGLPPDERPWASVDAELALLGSGRDGSAGLGSVVNPYFGAELPFVEWRARHPGAPLRYLVARLTGYQTRVDPETGVPRDVKRLIDAALAPGGGSLYAVDEDPHQKPGRREGNAVMLAPTAAALQALGRSVRHDTSPSMLRDLRDLAGYASWGSNDRQSAPPPFYGDVGGAQVPGRFGPRAVAIDLVSTNARSFSEPTPYGQSLVADLIRAGVAGAAGHVYEPTLAGVPRPYLLLWHYVRGAPAAEAYFRSVPYLGWTNVWIGDPLLRVADPAVAAPPDRDGDGIPDAQDDCLWMPNPDQRDTDADGFGNLCDPDVDGDGRVTGGVSGEEPGVALADLRRIERSALTGLYVPDHDLDGDGQVDARDLGIAQLYLHLAPGPRGRGPGGPPDKPSRGPAAPPMSP